jgi:nucleoside-diphosphate-sugar epimerase
MVGEAINLVTGARGQLGSHIAEQLRAAGAPVRALVRPGKDVSFLRDLGVELVEGDLRDAGVARAALAGAGIVYHCAARVSDWGPWSAFEEEAVTSTRNLVTACKAGSQPRLLHVSSISVYGHPRLRPGESITEETPLGQRFWMWDYYPRAKLLAERVAWDYPAVTVVRPCWIYGPRDRIAMTRLLPGLLQGKVPVIGRGDNLLNILYAGDVAAGAILAANSPGAVRQAYNLCSEGEVTQRDLVNAMTDALSLPRVRKRVPYFLALRFAFLGEAIARLLRRADPPTITRRAIYLVGRGTCFSSAKARQQLGWQPRVGIQEGVRRTLEWLFSLEENRHLQPRIPVLPTVSSGINPGG